jgi:prophage regulatory protein
MSTSQQRTALLRQSFPNAHAPSVATPQTARQLDKALRILRMKQLIERTNLSRATLYVLMATDPTFPKKLKLTARSIGFIESEVDGWIEARAQLRGAI